MSGWITAPAIPVKRRALRILDFDIENRPSSYWYEGKTTAQVSCIAWAFTSKPREIWYALLTKDEASYREMLEAFVAAYNEADMVAGHYIREHDLGIINGALVEENLPPLSPKLTQDTKLDLIGWKDLPKSQEFVAEMLGVPAPKVQMSQYKWRLSNRLVPEGLELTAKRAVGDVKQNMQMRKVALKRGLMGPPKVWRP